MSLKEKKDRARQAVAAMNTHLRSALEEIREALAAVAGDEIRQRYKIGSLLCRVIEDTERFGDRGVPALAAALGVGKMTLYRHAKVAQRWTPSEIARFEDLRDCLDRPLTWSHLIVLSERPASRESWIRKAQAGAWSVRRLEKEMGVGNADAARGELSAEGNTRSAILRSLDHAEQWSTNLGGSMALLVERLEDTRSWTPELDGLRTRLTETFRGVVRRAEDLLARLERLDGGAESAPRLKVAERRRSDTR